MFSFVAALQCNSSPCYNRGICKDFINYYTCTCVAGFHGQRCENGNKIITS